MALVPFVFVVLSPVGLLLALGSMSGRRARADRQGPRVGFYQSANSIAGFAVPPLILLVVGQATGVMLLGPALFAVLGLVLAVLDVILMRWIAVTFDREGRAAFL